MDFPKTVLDAIAGTTLGNVEACEENAALAAKVARLTQELAAAQADAAALREAVEKIHSQAESMFRHWKDCQVVDDPPDKASTWDIIRACDSIKELWIEWRR